MGAESSVAGDPLQHLRGAGRCIAAPGDDLIGTDEGKVGAIEVARLVARHVENRKRHRERSRCRRERSRIDRGRPQAQERELEAERVVERAPVGQPQVRSAAAGAG